MSKKGKTASRGGNEHNRARLRQTELTPDYGHLHELERSPENKPRTVHFNAREGRIPRPASVTETVRRVPSYSYRVHTLGQRTL